LITQRFPPHTGAAARRLGWLVQQYAKAGKVYVIRMGEEALELPEVTRTIVIPNRDIRSVTGQSGKTLPGTIKSNPIVRELLKMRQAFPLVYLTDDGGADYRNKALAASEQLIREQKITTIVSSFRPWSDHLVARKLKQRYPHLRWIADFRDLPVDPVRKDVWWPGLQRWWGKSVIAGADELWAVSEGQREQLSPWHPTIKVVRNPLLSLPPAGNNPVTDRFSISYTGSLYPGLQSVEPLVKALQELLAEGLMSPEKLCLQYRGKDAALFREWTAGLPEACLDIDAFIAPAAAQEMQRNAQVLLLLNWSAPQYYGVLTAKLWDYLASGRPTLALVNGPADPELTNIISGAAAGAVFAKNEQGLADWLRKAYRQWVRNGVLPWATDRENLAQYL